MRMPSRLVGAVAAAAVLGSASASTIVNSSTAMFDFTALPGYGVASSSIFNMSSSGWAGWSVPTGKVVLGATVTALGGQALSVSAPGMPGVAYPHYTYGANEYGWVVRNGTVGQQVQVDVYYADMPVGYSINKSPQLNYGANGWGGWSAPDGHVVVGGGYEFLNAGASPLNSTIGTPGSTWPHYTFTTDAGWVVQANQEGGPAFVYSISFVPAPGAMALLGVAGLVGSRRRR
jgi:hypothetical protein